MFFADGDCWLWALLLEVVMSGLDPCGTCNVDMWGLREVTGSRVSRMGEVDG